MSSSWRRSGGASSGRSRSPSSSNTACRTTGCRAPQALLRRGCRPGSAGRGSRPPPATVARSRPRDRRGRARRARRAPPRPARTRPRRRRGWRWPSGARRRSARPEGSCSGVTDDPLLVGAVRVTTGNMIAAAAAADPSGTLGGSALASWTPFWGLLGVFLAVNVGLFALRPPVRAPVAAAPAAVADPERHPAADRHPRLGRRVDRHGALRAPRRRPGLLLRRGLAHRPRPRQEPPHRPAQRDPRRPRDDPRRRRCSARSSPPSRASRVAASARSGCRRRCSRCGRSASARCRASPSTTCGTPSTASTSPCGAPPTC